ncbi:hypothetical protein WG886_004345 [Yersinia enterocolitica]
MAGEHLMTVSPTTEANWHNENVRTEGLLLRDYFAAKAMAVAWSALEAGYFEADVESSTDKMAACAYQLADAMIKARG